MGMVRRVRKRVRRGVRATGIFSSSFVFGWTLDISFVVDLLLYLYVGGVYYMEAGSQSDPT